MNIESKNTFDNWEEEVTRIIHNINNMGFHVINYELIELNIGESEVIPSQLHHAVMLVDSHREVLNKFRTPKGILFVNNSKKISEVASDSKIIFTNLITQLNSASFSHNEVVLQRLAAMKSDTERMLRLCEELLAMLLEMRKIKQSPAMINVFTEIGKVRESFLAALQKKDMDLVNEVDETNGDLYYSKAQFEDIVYELTHNAVKYGLEGSNVRIAYTSENGSPTLTVYSVSDPIPFEKLETVFEGERLEEHTDIEGTGVGLAALKALIEENEGTIEVVTTEKGNAFVVRF